MHTSGGNQTRNPSKQVSAVPHLKASGIWDGHTIVYIKTIKHLTKFIFMFYKIISGESDGR